MAITYTTWNPDDKAAGITLSNGDLTATRTGDGFNGVRSILGVSTGKWYWEVQTVKIGTYKRFELGIADSGVSLATNVYIDPDGYIYYGQYGKKGNNNVLSDFGAVYDNAVIGIALDMGTGKIWWAKDGVWQASGDPVAGTNEAFSGIVGTFYAVFSSYETDSHGTANFGASAFSYSVPSGFNPGFYSGSAVDFTFTDPTPTHLSTVYGVTEQVCLTTTISGEEPNYVYDASFYDEFDVQIGTTVSGIQSGQSAESNEYLSTPSGIDYSWYMTATSSGVEDTSDTYTFHNRFLASGTTEVNGVLTSGIDVRLYSRDTGELVGSSVSTISGTFNIETQCNSESYCVALSPYTDTNSLIYDFLEPD